MWVIFWIFLLLETSCSLSSDLVTSTDLAGGLYCYTCSPTASDNCSSYSQEQGTLCQEDETFCKVSRVEFLTIDKNEQHSNYDSDEMTTWSYERGCASDCNSFCVTMGARTKISYCTSCCNSTLCNTDNHAANNRQSSILLFLQFMISLLLLCG